jgi:hypothetical protein
MSQTISFPWQQEHVVRYSQHLLTSFQHWTGRPLLDLAGSPDAIAHGLFEAAIVVVSHGMEEDPVLNYGNRKALELWQMDWTQLIRTPSRYTAEPMEQPERAKFLEQARTQGYIRNYQGIRISSTGQRFWIRDVIVWAVLDQEGKRCGQAATFANWQFVEPEPI